MPHLTRTAFLGLAATMMIAGPSLGAEGIETPNYEVLASETTGAVPYETIELRRYGPMIVAEVTVMASNRDEASSKGFRPLADYIFGRNAPGGTISMTAPVTTTPATSGEGEKIAMTAPVTTAATESDDGHYTVRFMMPSKYTMETLPEPLDPEVRLSRIPARILVALRFVGERSPERVAAAEKAILTYLEETGLEPSGPFVTAGYDGPDTPISEKRWEVQRPVVSVDPVTP